MSLFYTGAPALATGEIPGTFSGRSRSRKPGRPKRTASLDEGIGNIGSARQGADDARQMTLRCGERMGQRDAHADASGHRCTWQTRCF